jgi:1-acyl-sn-glycerol-3-phosphate acyltransferase
MARVAAATVRISLPTMIEARREMVSAEVCNARLAWWSRRLLDDARIRLEVNGREHLRPGERYIVMSNHQSHYDIPVLYQALGIPMRMVAKQELFRIPFIGKAMRAAGFVEVDRENRHRSMETLLSVPHRLRKDTSIWIAPEGTRSRVGRLGSFRRGGFYMAMTSGMRILPVTIDGTRRVLPAGKLRVRRGQEVVVTISAPLYPMSYGQDGINDLVSAVRAAIELPMMTPSLTIASALAPVGQSEWAQ